MAQALTSKHGVQAGFIHEGGVDGYLARPDDQQPYPGVLLIQEWWGIEPHIQDLTERLAREGYVVLAPDLYHGRVAKEPGEAEKEMMALDKDRAVTEIAAALDHLKAREDVAPKRLGVVGFCMGGLLTWKVAERKHGDIAAIAPFYAGFYEPTVEDIRKMGAPVLAVWGTRDASIPASQRERIVALLEQEGKPHEVVLCDAGHAFMNDQHPTHDAACARQAWEALKGWFAKHLR